MMEDVKDYPPYLDYHKPRKTTTNADRIRAMSDDELAQFLCDAELACDVCEVAGTEIACDPAYCRRATIEWLKQPAEGE